MGDTKLSVTLTGDNSPLQNALNNSSELIEKFGSDVLKLAVGFGTVAGAANMLAEKIVEIGKAIIEFIPNSIEGVGQLTAVFKGLAITANMDTDAFNGYLAAMELSGGKAEDLADIVQGMARGIKANSTVLVENLHLTDKSALSHMTLAEYIHKVVATMDTYQSFNDKNQLMMAAFGRGGMKMAAMLKELDKNMAEGAEQSKRYSQVTEDLVEKETALTEAKGRLTIAEKALQAAVAADHIDLDIELKNTEAKLLGTTESIEQLTKAKLAAQAVKLLQEGKIQDSGKEVRWGAGPDDHTFERTKADWEILIQRAKEYNAAQAQEKTKTEAAKIGTFTGSTNTDAADAAAKKRGEEAKARQRMHDRDIQKSADLAVKEDERVFETRENNALNLMAFLDQDAKKKDELAKLSADKEVGAAKASLAERKQVLDMDVALGQISAEDELRIRKYLSQAEEDVVVQALSKRLDRAKGNEVEFQTIENEITAIHQKGTLERSKLDKEAAIEGKKEAEFYASSVANSLSSTLMTAVSEHKNAGAQIKAVWADLAKEILKHIADTQAKKLADLAADKVAATWRKRDAAEDIADQYKKAIANELASKTAVVGAEQTNAANNSTIGPATESTTANLGEASSGIFASFSSVPWVGVALAIAAIAAMMAVMKGITGKAKGGDVEGGTPYLVGEEGPELFNPGNSGVIIPHDMTAAMQMTAALAQAGTATNRTLSSNSRLGSSYASGAREAMANHGGSGSSGTGGGEGATHFHLEGANIMGTTVESMRQVGRQQRKAQRDWGWRKG